MDELAPEQLDQIDGDRRTWKAMVARHVRAEMRSWSKGARSSGLPGGRCPKCGGPNYGTSDQICRH